ncbi:MAG: MFS transporter [Planctomycetota bacterium]
MSVSGSRSGNDTDEYKSLVHRALRANQGELRPLLLSAAYFFVLLFGYFMLRPVREAMGVQRSMGDLRWLFGATCVVSLLITLVFGQLVSKVDRRRFIPVVHRCIIACLLVFVLVLSLAPDVLGLATGYVFYVWISVVNLFVVSVFWAFMADVWTLSQGKRLFAAIGVGGTLGALAGSSVPWWLADRMPSWGLMLLAGVCFEVCVRFVVWLGPGGSSQEAKAPDSIGGNAWAGLGHVLSSPYLAGIGGYIGLMATSSTLIYFAKASFVFDETDTLSARIAAFGQLDAAAQALTLLVQLFITSRIINRLGVGGTLIILPAVTLLGFAALAVAPVWGVLVLFQALHRAARYSIARPSRETLFTVVPDEDKYKAKPVLDVFVYRGGDVVGVLLSAAPLAVAGVGVFALIVTPVSAAWAALAAWLGRSQSRLGNTSETPADDSTASNQAVPGSLI